jgi:hypothetical protein
MCRGLDCFLELLEEVRDEISALCRSRVGRFRSVGLRDDGRRRGDGVQVDVRQAWRRDAGCGRHALRVEGPGDGSSRVHDDGSWRRGHHFVIVGYDQRDHVHLFVLRFVFLVQVRE